MIVKKVFYAAGPGDVIAAHENTDRGLAILTEVSITFSEQIEACCKRLGAPFYFVSYKSPPSIRKDKGSVLELRPKPMQGSKGLKYHLAECLYGIGLAMTAKKFAASVAVVDSGSSHFFMGFLYRALGIPVITVLHNTIWPSGFPPTRPIPKFVLWLDKLFFRWGSSATIGVSPECNRQVAQLTGGRHGPLYEMRAQFLRERFVPIPPPPKFNGRNLRIIYIGRVLRIKGVFDILEMAKRLNEQAPGRIEWEICGGGGDLAELRKAHESIGLKNVIIRGWVSIEEMQEVYTRCHLSIVPTRSDFAEGLAMTAAEGILAGRPVITNPVVPALEVLRSACLEARTNNVQSYVDAIMSLLNKPSHYEELRLACSSVQGQFYDRNQGLEKVLYKVMSDIL